MATPHPQLKPQMAISTPRPTATSTKTPEAAGTRLKALLNPPRARATPLPLNPPQATRVPRQVALRPPTAMAESKRAVAPQPGVVAEAAAVGNPGRIVPAVRQAAVVAAAGAVAGNLT